MINFDLLLDYFRVALYGILSMLFFMYASSPNRRKSDWIMSFVMMFLGINLTLRNASQPESANILADYGMSISLAILVFILVRGLLVKHEKKV